MSEVIKIDYHYEKKTFPTILKDLGIIKLSCPLTGEQVLNNLNGKGK